MLNDWLDLSIVDVQDIAENFTISPLSSRRGATAFR